MALLSNVTFNSYLVFSLFAVSLLCPTCSASQPAQPSASEAGSGGGQESDQIYMVAPTLEDCPNDTHCQTLSYYVGKYTNELSNVVFWFLPGTHNLSRTWNLKNSRNVTLLGVDDLANSDKSSGGMPKILCQKGLLFGGISVSKSNFTVVENIAIAYCAFALVFQATVNATVRNVIVTHSFASLQVSTSQRFTLTKSAIEYCFLGIAIGSSSAEISNSQISNCWFMNIQCILNGGSITLNQIISDGSRCGICLAFAQDRMKGSSLEEK